MSKANNSTNSNKVDKRRLDIEFMYLDLGVCNRCQGTEAVLEEAISEVSELLKKTGIEVDVHKVYIQSEEQAQKLGFVTSPTIRINGHDIQLNFKESLCESCGDLCEDEVDCRVWIYQGKEYNVPPKAMIIDAILRETYGKIKSTSGIPPQTKGTSSNLKRFFAAKSKKEAQINQDKDLLPKGTCGCGYGTSSCCD